ncbi:DUF4238 domain-containing protein [Leptospira idonii]|uniref:DUF4238 domain-containing protein n=1 Tax=Leptospira idonii TaxID=1193500 RepID=A0A4R9M1P1_9LEPT|nr:DUF4238 domain-containing protein [Leptospira idonii]TGN20640.1 DUF4238 domain-containing protein [Leptospira idonii]
MNIPYKKRRQHTVWKHYLKPWTDRDGQIFCSRNRKDVFKASLENVGNIRDFYKPHKLNSDEINLLRHLFINKSPDYLKKLNEDWIKFFTIIFELKYLLELNQPTEEIKKEFDVIIHNLGEELQSSIENKGKKYLDYLYNESIDFYSNSEDNMNFNLFIMVQLFRTEKIKNGLKNIPLNIPNINFENLFNIIAICSATNSAGSLFLERNSYKLSLLRNKTKFPFITCDSPVVNTKANFETNEPPVDMEIFYPITPISAVIITTDLHYNEFIDIENPTIIQKFNRYIIKSHFQQIYLNSENALSFL